MSQLGKHARHAWIIVPLALLAAFVVTFDPNVNRWPVNFTWLAALLIWAFGIWRHDRPPRDSAFDRKYVWPIVFFVPVFGALWLPFYDNWRWVDAGDSFGWYLLPLSAARNGLSKSILSVYGVSDIFTYTEVIVVNFLMFVFGPDFFWHRAGNFLISTLSLVAIYAFFSLILDFPWGPGDHHRDRRHVALAADVSPQLEPH